MSAFELIDTEPVVDQCGYCDNGVHGDQYCRYCNGDGVSVFDRSSLLTLAHSLAVAGGLCEAFNEGWSSGWDAARPTELGDTPGWYPGCGFPMETTATLTPTPSAK